LHFSAAIEHSLAGGENESNQNGNGQDTTVTSIKVNPWKSADRLYIENLLVPLAGLESSKILPAAQLFR
jgi:hypothetical protein